MNISKAAHTCPINDDELTKVFNEIDDDGNGYITPREAKRAFKKLAEKFNINRVSQLILHHFKNNFMKALCVCLYIVYHTSRLICTYMFC